MKYAIILALFILLSGCGRFYDPPNYAETASGSVFIE